MKESEFNAMNGLYERFTLDRHLAEIDEAEDEAERKSEHRDPWYFDYWPSDEQLEYYKRGGR
uniref:Uncharacterized protein n=1 Tax=viral metagenome TaxID=1070528 RepID=A0A6M3ITF2_9ZZZZ